MCALSAAAHAQPAGVEVLSKSRSIYWSAGVEQPRYGISHDDPSIVPDEQCRYDACVALPEGFDAPRQMLTTTLPGGRYAVLRFEGTVFQIGERWQALLRDWLPASGLQVDARPCYEYYPPGTTYDPQTGIFDCDICIPVEPL